MLKYLKQKKKSIN